MKNKNKNELPAGLIFDNRHSIAWNGTVIKSERICLSSDDETLKYPPKSKYLTKHVCISGLCEIICTRYQIPSIGAQQIASSVSSCKDGVFPIE